ncbi:ribonuclease III [Parapontixanthobacter aurantiacus]|uniref:ribonuclease III n=1 Tax=Parapontixanthobacter aurantiacus TaxID=1463599 RepID=UPI001EEEFFD8|nr:ribonuclease III [Parapontixanthobacter aurantiacus]
MSELRPETMAWLKSSGFAIGDAARWKAALTHGSLGEKRDYERLEFLGDRVLGLAIASWLYDRNTGPEGKLSLRLNALVSRETCAGVARAIGVPDHVRLGSQARADGGADSDNILGDVMEALLGASFLDSGYEATAKLVHKLWADMIASSAGQHKHPKSALQEWAAAQRRKPPEYSVSSRTGPDHAAKFTVLVKVKNVGEVEATASSKQDAETAAAKAFLEKYA